MSGWLEPLHDPEVRRGLIAAVLVGIPCACIGAYVVLRRMAFLGDALSHTLLPGLIAASLAGANLFAGALVAGLATALGIGWLLERRELREDTAIGVVFTAMFALGILLASTRYDPEQFHHILFGDLLGVSAPNLRLLTVVAVLVMGGLFLLHKELELASFDPRYAESIGIRTGLLRYVLLGLIALTVVAGFQAAGVVLTSALLVTPAAAASLLTQRLPRMMLLGSAFAVASVAAGLLAAFRFGVSSGAVTVLACTAFFAGAWIVRGRRRGGAA